MRLWAGQLSGAGLVGLLGACSAWAPTPPQPWAVEIPRGWSQSKSPSDAAGVAAVEATALVAWWRRFDDPQLEALVGRALQANTRIQGAQAALRQAQALRDGALASLWPTLNGSASAQSGTAGGQSTGDAFQVGLNTNWGIDVFGARRAALDAGQASVAANQASEGDVQVQIAAEVALNYILLRTAQTRSRIARENLASQEETLQITLWRQQAGLVTALEAEQARAAVEQNRAQWPLLQTSMVQTQHALAVLTGRPPAAGAELVAVWDADTDADTHVPQVRTDLRLNIPAQTLRQRADVRAAEYQMAAALARVGQAQAQR